jgi:hypothetical protein
VELENNFNLKPSVLRQWVKNGLLVARTIKGTGKHPDLLIFLISENKEMLPPKKLLQGNWVKEVKDGREEYCFGPWYWFVDPHEHLKGYGIMDYLKVVPKGNESGEGD